MLSAVDQIVLTVVGWIADHSPPFVAGFLGGLMGAELLERWKARH